MVTLRLEPEVAETLQAQADAAGMTLADYLRAIAGGLRPAANGEAGSGPRMIDDPAGDFDTVLDEFFRDNPRVLPSLPADFSRADIYADHD